MIGGAARERLLPGVPDLGTAAVLLTVPAVLLASRKYGSTRFAEGIHLELSGIARPISQHVWWFGCSILLYLVVPLLVTRAVPALRGERLGFSPGDARFGAAASGLLCLLMLPVVILAARSPAFAGTYPLAKGAMDSWPTFLLYEALYVAYFFSWEFLFRGFCLFPLAARLGAWPAILVQNIPFVLLHDGKPGPEAFGSLLAGVALGLLALRTRSFLWGFLLHATVAVAMDVAASGLRFGA